MTNNPYAQVALTYLRRPFSTPMSWVLSIACLCMMAPIFIIAHSGGRDFAIVMLMQLFLPYFLFAVHVKGQFADSRAHLTPNFRRVHAAVAAIVALIIAVLLPGLPTLWLGWRAGGLVAVTVTMLGGVLWLMTIKSALGSMILIGCWFALILTQAGQDWLRQLVSGEIGPQAAGLFGLGTLLTLWAGARLMRLTEDDPAYHNRTHQVWDMERNMQSRWAVSDKQRLLPGLSDWIEERQMARLTRHALWASTSRWSRVCRWQAGMVAGWSLLVWIIGSIVYVYFTFLLLSRAHSAAAGQMPMLIFLGITFVPAIQVIGVAAMRTFKLNREIMLPVDRKSYVRQLGAAAALSQFQLWGGCCLALGLWWRFAGLLPFQPAMFALVLAVSAALQVLVFATTAWTARYRSRTAGLIAIMALMVVCQFIFVPFSAPNRSAPAQLSSIVFWLCGAAVFIGLLITYDAYRRWLRADIE